MDRGGEYWRKTNIVIKYGPDIIRVLSLYDVKKIYEVYANKSSRKIYYELQTKFASWVMKIEYGAHS